jgi:hypothetical protein
VQRVPPGRRRIWVLVHKNILLASVTKNNAPADGSFRSGPRYKFNGKDQVTNWVAPADKQKRPRLETGAPLRESPRGRSHGRSPY